MRTEYCIYHHETGTATPAARYSRKTALLVIRSLAVTNPGDYSAVPYKETQGRAKAFKAGQLHERLRAQQRANTEAAVSRAEKAVKSFNAIFKSGQVLPAIDPELIPKPTSFAENVRRFNAAAPSATAARTLKKTSYGANFNCICKGYNAITNTPLVNHDCEAHGKPSPIPEVRVPSPDHGGKYFSKRPGVGAPIFYTPGGETNSSLFDRLLPDVPVRRFISSDLIEGDRPARPPIYAGPFVYCVRPSVRPHNEDCE
jgi:hypothetical protein